jgi:hypothetical protein
MARSEATPSSRKFSLVDDASDRPRASLQHAIARTAAVKVGKGAYCPQGRFQSQKDVFRREAHRSSQSLYPSVESFRAHQKLMLAPILSWS